MRIDNLIAPHDWKLSAIGEACEVHNHLREPISEIERRQIQGNYPYYGPTGIVDYLDHYRIEGKYALIGEDGDHFLKFNIWSMTLLVEGNFNVNNHAHLLYGKAECLTEWVYYFYQHADITPYITRQGAGRFKLNKAALLKLSILLPPLEEQRKIAVILSTWDEAIGLVEQLIAALGRRKQALMQLLLTGAVRFPGFEGEWRVGEFIDFLQLQRGYDLPVAERIGGDVKIMASNGLIGFHNESMVKGPGVITGRSGTIGKVFYEESDFWPLNTTLFIKDFKGNYPLYVYYFLKNFQLDRFGGGTGVPTLNRNDVHPTAVEFPNTDEQLKISHLLQQCDMQVDMFQSELGLLQEQKRGLMQQLLTGAVRV